MNRTALGSRSAAAATGRSINKAAMAILIGHPSYPHRGGELEPVKPHILVMCGRYASFFPAEALAQLFGTVNPLLNLETTWNMAPSGDAPSAGLSRWRAPSRRAEVGLI